MKLKFKALDSVYLFCNMANKFNTDIDLMSGRYIVDAKSIVGIFSLSLDKPVEIKIHDETLAPTILEKTAQLGIDILE